MSAEQPRCRRERIAADLNDSAQRRSVYATVGPAPALMVTEGLLLYLPAATVEALAAEAWRQSGVAHWMSDISTTAFANAVGANMMRSVRHVQASDSLAGEQILEVLRHNGWVTAARRSYITDVAFAMDRIKRLFGERPPTGDSSPPPPQPDDPTGVHLLARS